MDVRILYGNMETIFFLWFRSVCFNNFEKIIMDVTTVLRVKVVHRTIYRILDV